MTALWFYLALLTEIIASGGFIVHLVSQKKWVFKVSLRVLTVGFASHTIYLIYLYGSLSPVPGVDFRAAFSLFAWSVICAYLLFQARFRIIALAGFAAPMAALLMLLSAAMPQVESTSIPDLKGIWLAIHIAATFMGNGLFAIAFLAGIMYLLQERHIKKKKFGTFFNRLPSLDSLDLLGRYAVIYGFPFFTVGMITGSIYAWYTLGSYWNWDPKEVWSLITWLLYAALLHERLAVGWRGRRAAIMAIACFAMVMFTFVGVGMWFGGYHSFGSSVPVI
ncbi:MAG: cytochrome c biogenesis protein CcsA [Desulfatiglandaceae bacterium]